ncbi:hypothetical protein MKW92_025193, partial [Papaver armeniacum]
MLRTHTSLKPSESGATTTPCDDSGNIVGLFQCPFKGLDGCKNGVGGKGLLNVSLFSHLKNLHYKREGGTDKCCERVRNCGDVYQAWEFTLRRLESCLYTHCMHIYSLGKKCTHLEPHELAPPPVSIYGIVVPVGSDVPTEAEVE